MSLTKYGDDGWIEARAVEDGVHELSLDGAMNKAATAREHPTPLLRGLRLEDVKVGWKRCVERIAHRLRRHHDRRIGALMARQHLGHAAGDARVARPRRQVERLVLSVALASLQDVL